MNAHAEILSCNRCHVQNYSILLSVCYTVVCKHVLICIVCIYPEESFRIIVLFIECRIVLYKTVKLTEELAEHSVHIIFFDKEPVKLLGFVPLSEHCKLIAHEVELLTGVSHHICIECANLCEFILIISAPHLLYDSCLTMYNFYELITQSVVIQQNGRMHAYKVNFSAAVHVCRQFFLGDIPPPLVEALLAKHISPIRPGRSRPRKLKPKQALSFLYRVA